MDDILIIDDDPSVALSMKLALQGQYRVEVCHEAGPALQHLSGPQRYKAIVCDLHLPDLDGPEFFHKVLAIDPDQAARILFVTGGIYTEGLVERLAPLKNSVLNKPFRFDEIRQAVALIAGRS
jgi:DNA-binding response OmpR family regulator